MRILLVNDDETLVDLLTRTLAEQSYALDVATDGEQGWIYGSTYTYDLIILDWSLPKLDGVSLCKRFRASGYSTPIILLTSSHDSQNKIRGLDTVADDYICKPFDVEELAARIRVFKRRLNTEKQPDKPGQHLAALTAIWEKHQPQRQQQLATLEQASVLLQTGNLSLSERLSAIVAAHSLAGNLGQFGLERGSQLARELEHLLQNNPSQEQWGELSTKITALREEISSERDISAHITQKISENSPLLLIVGDDSNLTSQLTEKAANQGIRTKILPTPELVTIWLEEKQACYEQLPQAVLLTIYLANSELSERQEYLTLIAEFNLLVPSIPVIVIADRDRFQDRLQVARHGGSFYLTQPVNPSQTITLCQQIIQRSSVGKKIMIVDDDLELLQVLPSLLKPWEFDLTTLDDPRQFWDVLQAVNPDLLVLDIEMPHLSGIELCKVLRTDPYWCKLPVLFLSVHTDTAMFTQALASGGNGFVNKPLITQQLVSQILNLLEVLD